MKFIIWLTVFVCFQICHSLPLIESIESDTKNTIKNYGQKTLENFDDVFYGLLDEAAQLVTQDQKGAFKEMVLRHRSDLTKNVNENLLKKDKITLQDVSNMFARELKNRAELFNYLGSGIWNKISTTSKSLFNRYRLYCSENPSNMLCLSDKDDKTKSNEIEHEDLP